MSIAEELLTKHTGNKLEAAYELCYRLMAHDPFDPYRQGYTIGNALMAAASQFDLDRNEVAVVAERLVERGLPE